MINFQTFLNLNEEQDKQSFSKAKALVLGVYKKIKKEIPDGVKKAKDRTSLMDSIKSWKDSDNAQMKNTYKSITQIFKNNSDSEDTDNADNAENKDTKDNKDTKEQDKDKELEQRKKDLENALKDPTNASDEVLNSSDYIISYDEKKALDKAKVEQEQEELKDRIKKAERENAEKRAENFKSLMDSLSEFLEVLFPEGAKFDSLSKIGDNAVEQQKKQNEQDAKFDEFDKKVKEKLKTVDNENKDKKDSIEAAYNSNLKKIDLDDGPYANQIESACKTYRDITTANKQNLDSLTSAKEKYQKEIEKLQYGYGNEKKIKDYKAEIADLDKAIKQATEDYNKAKENENSKRNNERKRVEKDIQTWRENQKKRLEKEHEVRLQELEVEGKKKKTEIENKKSAYIEYINYMTKRYPDKREWPISAKNKESELLKDFQKSLLSDEEFEKLQNQKSQDSNSKRSRW